MGSVTRWWRIHPISASCALSWAVLIPLSCHIPALIHLPCSLPPAFFAWFFQPFGGGSEEGTVKVVITLATCMKHNWISFYLLSYIILGLSCTCHILGDLDNFGLNLAKILNESYSASVLCCRTYVVFGSPHVDQSYFVLFLTTSVSSTGRVLLLVQRKLSSWTNE